MKRILAATTVALMSASLFAAPVLAQGGQTNGNQSQTEAAPGTGDNSAVDSGTTAAIGTDFNSVVSSIRDGGASAEIGALGTASTVNVVRLGDLQGHDPAMAEQAVSENNASIEELRAAIVANPALYEQLQTQGADLSQVVAADVGANGEVTFYVM